MICIVVPTIPGREQYLDHCLDAYRRNTTPPFTLIVEYGHSAVGLAWNAGAARADGDYLHLTGDDIEPLPGWDQAAKAAADRGVYPAARVDRPDGVTQWWGSQPVPVGDGDPVRAGWIPFMTRAMWQMIGPSLDIHYCTDDWLSWRAERAGFPNVYVDGYAFRHHEAQVRDWMGMTERQRRTADARVFEQAKRDYIKEMATDG